MNVTMKCHTNKNHSGVLYASLENEQGELCVSATVDYCISAAQGRGYVITNAQEVLLWLHMNCDFKGYV